MANESDPVALALSSSLHSLSPSVHFPSLPAQSTGTHARRSHTPHLVARPPPRHRRLVPTTRRCPVLDALCTSPASPTGNLLRQRRHDRTPRHLREFGASSAPRSRTSTLTTLPSLSRTERSHCRPQQCQAALPHVQEGDEQGGEGHPRQHQCVSFLCRDSSRLACPSTASISYSLVCAQSSARSPSIPRLRRSASTTTSSRAASLGRARS